MKLPGLLSNFYIFFSKFSPENLKPTLRGLYYSLTKLVLYRTFNIFAAVDIETASKCNIKCPYCPTAFYDRGNYYMDEKLFKKIVEELTSIPYKGRISPHFYGEPLLDKRLPELLAYARKKLPKANIIIHTNGILLDKNSFDTYIKSGVNGFVVTLHNDLVKRKIDELFEKLNKKEREKIRILEFSKTHLFNRGGLVKPKNTKRIKRCFYVRDEIAINYAGDVVCTNDFFAKHSFGNVKNEKLMDIWNKPDFKKLRHDLLLGKFTLDICKHCAK